MRIRDLTPDDPLLGVVFRDVLRPSFPPAELVAVESLERGLAQRTTTVGVVVDRDDQPVAAAVGEWSQRSRVQLLSYLAVRQPYRGGGHGGRLLEHMLASWRQRYQPCAIVAEVHHPQTHEDNEAYGDSLARVRFYARHRATALDLPYFQPALAAAFGRRYGMLFLSLHLDPELSQDSPETYASGPIREFMIEYFEATEGRVPHDPAAKALFAAIDQPDGIRTLLLTDPARLPFSAEL